MKTGTYEKYWKHFVLIVIISLNLCVKFTPQGIFLDVKGAYAQEGGWDTGTDWYTEDFTETHDKGIYTIDDDGDFVYCPECATHVDLDLDIVCYGHQPESSPVDFEISDLWERTVMPDDYGEIVEEWSYFDYMSAVFVQIESPPPPLANVHFAAGISSTSTSQKSLDIIQAVMQCAGETDVTISSTTRTPNAQAVAMYNNCMNLGTNHEYNLYSSFGDQVIDVYAAGKTNNYSREQIISNMTSKIFEIGPTNVSKHCADPSDLNVIDIAPTSVSDLNAFENCILSTPGISNYFFPPFDAGIHIEIPQ